MENNFIQMASHAVAYTIGPIFRHIIECAQLYFTNGFKATAKPGRKTSSVALAVWHVVPYCWNQMMPLSSSSIFANKNSFNMAR